MITQHPDEIRCRLYGLRGIVVAAFIALVCAVSLSDPVLSQEVTPAPASPLTQQQGETDGVPATAATLPAQNQSLPRDLSPWNMFLGADIVVKAVMLGLAFSAFVAWTIWIAKLIELFAAKRKVRRALRFLARVNTLEEADAQLHDERDPVTKLVRAAVDEVRTSSGSNAESLKERVSWMLERLQIAAGRRVGRGMNILATIGATAPFVGLFGTVWGIMNSFIGISTANTTNLAVVAPGIAEALLATALGLFAAIPAVVIYNLFTRSIASYRTLMADAGALVMRLVSRRCDDLERQLRAFPRAAE